MLKIYHTYYYYIEMLRYYIIFTYNFTYKYIHIDTKN